MSPGMMSTAGGTTGGTREGATTVAGNGSSENAVFVAVKKDFKQGKHTLKWAVKNTHGASKFVVAHVYVPSQTIPLLGGWFHVDQLTKQQVKSYRILERENIDKSLNEYMTICRSARSIRSC